jgi:hypothetical protein
MQKWWSSITNFSPKEHGLFSPDLEVSGAFMDYRFMVKLQIVRGRHGRPWRINSGYRTDAHNRRVGGGSNSPHLYGRAVDISTVGWTDEEITKVIAWLFDVGMTGIGRANTFIHADDMRQSEGFNRPLYWDYRTGRAGNYKHPSAAGFDVS